MPKFTKQCENFKLLVRKVRQVSPEAAQKLVNIWNSSAEYKEIINFVTDQKSHLFLNQLFVFNYTIEGYEYWKDIIKRCVKAESIFAIPQKDIQELIEHCEDNLIHGSIYSESLLRHIRGGKDKQNNFLGYDLSKPSETSFVLLEESNNREDAAKLLLIKSAPSTMPREQDYPTRFKYLQAKLAYEMASKVTK